MPGRHGTNSNTLEEKAGDLEEGLINCQSRLARIGIGKLQVQRETLTHE